MDVTAIQEAFDRVSKKQRLCYAKTHDVIDRTLHEVEAAAEHLNGIVDWKPEVRKGILTDLQLKLTGIAPSTQVRMDASMSSRLMECRLFLYTMFGCQSPYDIWLITAFGSRVHSCCVHSFPQ